MKELVGMGTKTVLGGVAPSTKDNPLGQIEPNRGHVIGQGVSGVVRYRVGNQTRPKHLVEVWPRGDLMREVELPRTPEAEVSQLPVLRAFRTYVKLTVVDDTTNFCHNPFSDRLASALEVTAEDRALDRGPCWAVSTGGELGDREGLRDERVDAIASDFAVGEKRLAA